VRGEPCCSFPPSDKTKRFVQVIVRFAVANRIAYISRMPRKPIELPPEVARAF